MWCSGGGVAARGGNHRVHAGTPCVLPFALRHTFVGRLGQALLSSGFPPAAGGWHDGRRRHAWQRGAQIQVGTGEAGARGGGGGGGGAWGLGRGCTPIGALRRAALCSVRCTRAPSHARKRRAAARVCACTIWPVMSIPRPHVLTTATTATTTGHGRQGQQADADNSGWPGGRFAVAVLPRAAVTNRELTTDVQRPMAAPAGPAQILAVALCIAATFASFAVNVPLCN